MKVASNHVVINEVCSNNFSVARDENGDYSDYIELYNPAMVPVSLTGFSLSDSKREMQKCLRRIQSIKRYFKCKKEILLFT